MPAPRWTREQDLAALYLRYVLRRDGLSYTAPASGELDEAMGRCKGSTKMRMQNLDFLDPSSPGGLNHPSKQTKRIWREYERDPERTLTEGREAYRNLLSRYS